MIERIVLDTNCLILSLPRKSSYHSVWTSFVEGRYALCVSNDIMEEYEEIISRFWGEEIANYVMNIISNNPATLCFDPSFRYNLIIQDPDDNKFVDCAMIANAKFIVTQDKHFDVLKEIDFPKIDVIDIDTFIRQIGV